MSSLPHNRTRRIVPIVEGPGEMEAVPNLLSRLLCDKFQRYDVIVGHPKNAHGCGNLTCLGGIERFLKLAFREPDCGGVLVIIDADRKCGVELARSLALRAQTVAVFPVAIVVPCREFETWFLYCAGLLAGKDLSGRSGLLPNTSMPEYPEQLDAKRWLQLNMEPGRGYKETEDQLPLTRLLDLEFLACHSRSFKRLQHAIEELLEAMENDVVCVTPVTHTNT